ncbi:MAG: molybdenum cofactor guanylyltransferase [Solirubrobacteraceae bacterium]|nr:molybdenum cofactor guanylyltransferase [Solirubrobacteraceae bacterium]
MGRPKASLDWEGASLLAHVAATVGAAVDGPVVVVGGPGQALPELPDGVRRVDDPQEGLGPLQGIATGLEAVRAQAPVAFVTATDMPLLHPAFVRRVVAALGDADVAMPMVYGRRQTLAAAYRTALAGVARELVAEAQLSPGRLLERCRVAWLDEPALLADPELAAADPHLDSVTSVDTPADYAAALARARADA